jgi:metal-responsive CopG/Arc/MetJ family transcriptional regulator
MRIKIDLPEDLVQQAKEAAVEANATLSEFIADSIRLALDSRRRKASRREFKIITSGKNGLKPGVNLDDTSSLLDIMDGLDKD